MSPQNNQTVSCQTVPANRYLIPPPGEGAVVRMYYSPWPNVTDCNNAPRPLDFWPPVGYDYGVIEKTTK
jgi:hypothetical protein